MTKIVKVYGKKQCEVNCKMPILRPAYGNKKVKFSSSNLNFLMRITNPRMLISDERVAVNPGGGLQYGTDGDARRKF